MELADAGSSNISEKAEDSPKRENTGLSANPELTETSANASKDLLLEKVSVLMSGFSGKEGLASRQRLVSNITKVIKESGIGYLPKRSSEGHVDCVGNRKERLGRRKAKGR